MFKIYLQDDINEEKGSLYIQLIKLCQLFVPYAADRDGVSILHWLVLELPMN